MSTPRIDDAMDALVSDGFTSKALKSIDYVVPGKWENVVGFDNMIRAVTGAHDDQSVRELRSMALAIYDEAPWGYQRALWIYRTVDVSDVALGALALASKVGERFPLLGFLQRFTPKADTTQAVDFFVKLTAEALGFFALRQEAADAEVYASQLQHYSHESLLRFAALVCFDGLLPLGPDFVRSTKAVVSSIDTSQIENNKLYGMIKDAIPGQGFSAKFAFMDRLLDRAESSIGAFTKRFDLNQRTVTERLESFIEFTDDKLDYVAASVDLLTDYFAHTGTQTVARHLIGTAWARSGQAGKSSLIAPPSADGL